MVSNTADKLGYFKQIEMFINELLVVKDNNAVMRQITWQELYVLYFYRGYNLSEPRMRPAMVNKSAHKRICEFKNNLEESPLSFCLTVDIRMHSSLANAIRRESQALLSRASRLE